MIIFNDLYIFNKDFLFDFFLNIEKLLFCFLIIFNILDKLLALILNSLILCLCNDLITSYFFIKSYFLSFNNFLKFFFNFRDDYIYYLFNFFWWKINLSYQFSLMKSDFIYDNLFLSLNFELFCIQQFMIQMFFYQTNLAYKNLILLTIN